MIIVVSLWGASGRTIGVFFDGRVQTGWFYLPFNQISLCSDALNCEEVLHNKTTVVNKNILFFRINTTKTIETIYVGPIISQQFAKALDRILLPTSPLVGVVTVPTTSIFLIPFFNKIT